MLPVCQNSAPALVPFFDDRASWLHAGLGVIAGVRPASGAMVALLFVLYQMFEREPLANKVGDFAEFGAGWLSALAVKGAN